MNKKIELKLKASDNFCSCSTGCCDNDIKIMESSSILCGKDILGMWKVRFGINRMNYLIEPGLYRIGNADENSPVLVTANYKLSFDMVRKELTGLNAWILALDTKGVNVWCAAGKGTFSTNELVKRIAVTHLTEIVKHKTLIVPQLGATGIAAHEVTKQSGFKVVYGPVEAKDIKEFLTSNMKPTAAMRLVNFTLFDRAVLTPIEFITAFKSLIILFGIFFILNVIHLGNFSHVDFYAFLGAGIVGAVVTPVLLPFIPLRAFSAKGYALGLLWTILVILLNDLSLVRCLSFSLILPALSSYFTLNFTGCSTYTSPSGVNKEMRFAIPFMLISAVVGFILLVTDLVISLF